MDRGDRPFGYECFCRIVRFPSSIPDAKRSIALWNKSKRAIAKYLAQKQQATKQKPTQKSVSKKQLFREWDDISDEEAAVLKAEFSAEDLAFAEVALSDYLPQLQQQDKI